MGREECEPPIAFRILIRKYSTDMASFLAQAKKTSVSSDAVWISSQVQMLISLGLFAFDPLPFLFYICYAVHSFQKPYILKYNQNST
jgi:hypothetical protein